MGPPRGHKKSAGSKKPPLTHFLCLPLVTQASRPQLEKSLREFREVVCPQGLHNPANGNDHDSHEDLQFLSPKSIRPVGTLHCTLGVMSLDDDQLSDAIQCLESLDVRTFLATGSAETNDASERTSLDPNITDHSTASPVHVSLKGLESMHAPKATSILYSAPSDPTGRLYPFCIAIQDLFKQRGFLVNDDRKLKLHVTIVKTVYDRDRKRLPKDPHLKKPQTSKTAITVEDEQDQMDSGNEGKTSKESPVGHRPNANSLKFDARPILEYFANHAWAVDVKLDRLAICEMGAKKTLDHAGNVLEECYTEIATIPLPF